MSLRPDDKALAAYLLRQRVVPRVELQVALEDAASSDRDLGESLVRLGILQPPAVLGYRAEVARRAHLPEADSTSPDPEPSRRGRSIRDTPREDVHATVPEDVRTTASRHHLPEDYPSTDLDPGDSGGGFDDGDTWYDLPVRMAAPELVTQELATRPVRPALELDVTADAVALELDDVLAQPTIVPGNPRASYPTPEAFDPQPSADATPEPYVDDAWSEHSFSATVHREPGAPISLPISIDRAIEEDTRSIPYRNLEGVDLEIHRNSVRLAPSGRRVEERYQLLGEIGRGGMGRILKARDGEIGREVAVKILLGGKEAPENMIRRFWMEVQATGQLEHPAIIPVHDVGRLPSGELFYVMKKLSGRTLADIVAALARGEPAAEVEFTRVRLLTIFQQIAYATAFAHARGVIHRDIKPANIMVGDYGEAMLLDWGLAKVIGQPELFAQPSDSLDRPRPVTLARYSNSGTATGTITGTPQYMSPEATEGKPELITTKSDVYGLGAVLYEILTYEPPFPDLGFVPTLVRVRTADVRRPRDVAPDRAIAVELEELCLRAMDKDPGERPGAKELADDIGRILEGAKERERRQQEAKARIREGRKATERWKNLKVELQSAESEAKRLQKEVPPWASVDKKQPVWAIEDRVSELKIEAISAFEESEAAFLRALGEVPDDREARSALAALYFARFGEAERARDVEGQRYYRNLVARYDDGVWARVLAGDGTLEISADLDDVEVSIARMEPAGRVLRPGEPTHLGRVPIARFEIPIGSYSLVFRREGEREILRPVSIGRTESVSVHVKFRTGAEIGDAYVLVPEGPAILGGDPIAHGGFDRKVVDVAEFAIARFPVTCEEYLAFINAKLMEGGLDAALRHVPRARAQEGHYWRYNRDEHKFEYPEKSPGGHSWVGNLPVSAISMLDAEAYIAWRAGLTGERLRLPHENEWEKAARGVDGRFFPWGDHFDPTFCKMKESRDRPYPEPEPVGAFPTDRSPYGVRDMAGGVREICVTDEGGSLRPVMRGGCWSDTGLFCRVAFRHLMQPDFVNTGLGFRVVKDL
ncbi:bifunctional serine/threonine-protein kinase/formylglycine-generating enzyme family protein [Myxococcota bacterium]|nr:bifunctional serine/threonine-protein kinase/formylglycine-generating enzyme family protein [Myxococcota bacterium]